jgi:hypothetical protein
VGESHTLLVPQSRSGSVDVDMKRELLSEKTNREIGANRAAAIEPRVSAEIKHFVSMHNF